MSSRRCWWPLGAPSIVSTAGRCEPGCIASPRTVASTTAVTSPAGRSRPASAAQDGSASGLTPSDDPWWLEPYPDALLEPAEVGPEARYEARESIALSFIAGLQQLPAQQRSVLVLRDVLGFPANEAAQILGTTTTAVNSALTRARTGFRPDRTADVVPWPRSAHEAAIVDRFVDAFQQGDLDRVVNLLSEDARLSMPPEPVRCQGSRAVAEFLRRRRFWGSELTLVPTRANGQPAFVYYLADPNEHLWRANGVMVLAVAGDHVSALTRFGGPTTIARFGFRSQLVGPGGRECASPKDAAMSSSKRVSAQIRSPASVSTISPALRPAPSSERR